MTYYRPQIVKASLDWKWIGVLHEGIISTQTKTHSKLDGITNIISYDGYRSQNPKKYEKDIAILTKALKKEPKNARYAFYLAQSFRDAEKLADALKTYEQRITMGGSKEEIFWSLSESAKLKDRLNLPKDEVIASYQKAHIYLPSRAEPLYYLARKCNFNQDYLFAYVISQYALKIPKPRNFLFCENWIYDYALLQEYATASFHLKKYDETISVCKALIQNPHAPKSVKKGCRNTLSLLQSAGD